MRATPYRDYAVQQLGVGYSPLPLPSGKKKPPPEGWTGRTAPMASRADVETWREVCPRANIGVRLSDGVMAIDVDTYDGKVGAETLARAEAALGPLPATAFVTSRGADHPSRKMLFRVPPGTAFVHNLGGLFGADVDVLQHGHRYVLAPGSMHPEGAVVRAYKPDGTPYPEGCLPHPQYLAELPAEWVATLQQQERPRTESAPHETYDALPEAKRQAVDCYMARTVQAIQAELRAVQAWSKDQTDDKGHGWERISADGAWDLGRLARATWNRLTLEEAERAFIDAAPTDAEWTQAHVREKWLSQCQRGEARRWPKRLDRDPAGTSDMPVGTTTPDQPKRPPLNVTYSAKAADWLRAQAGTGLLAGLFRRGNEIVLTPRIGEDGYIPSGDRDDDGPAQVRPVQAGALQALVQYTHRCYRVKHEDELPAIFPRTAAQIAVDAVDKLSALRPLRGIVHAPTMRPDGTIVSAPGYDETTRLLHLPEEAGLHIPAVADEPSREEVAAAVSLLMHMVSGFRFVSDHDRANYLGLLLTPTIRGLVGPPYKLGAIGAPQPGSGKTLLASTLRIVHGGVFRAEMPGDEAELRKQITAILDVTTGPVVHFDNLTGVLRSSTLAALLTSAWWDDRRLGATEMVSRPNDRLWIITGNNLLLGGDLLRRTLWVTVDPGVPDPHLRTGFAIPDLEGWVREHRGEIVHALLTLARAWVVVGRPMRDRRGSDGYATWIQTIDGILQHAGVAGTFDHPSAAAQEVGSDDDEWRDLLVAIHAAFGDTAWTAKELLAQVGHFGTIPEEALPAELAEKRVRLGPAAITKSFGMWLRNRTGRWAGQHSVQRVGETRAGVALWKVQTYGAAGSAGSAGTSAHPAAKESVLPRQVTVLTGPLQDPADPADPACNACGWPAPDGRCPVCRTFDDAA